MAGRQVCDGATDEERVEWELLPASEFKYLNKSSSYNLAGVDNAEEYRVCAAVFHIHALDSERTLYIPCHNI